MPHPNHMMVHTPGPHLLRKLLNHQELVVALSAVHSKECRCKRIHTSIGYMGSAPPSPHLRTTTAEPMPRLISLCTTPPSLSPHISPTPP